MDESMIQMLHNFATKDEQLFIPFNQVDEWERSPSKATSYWQAAQWGYQLAQKELLTLIKQMENTDDN